MKFYDFLWVIIIPIGSFVLIALICNFFLNLFEKFHSKPMWFKLAVIFGATHFILVNILGVYIYKPIQRDLEFGMMWFYFIYADMPIAYILFLFNEWFPNIGGLFSNYAMPYLIFATLGSLQYSLWGYLIGKLINVIFKK